MTETPIFGFEHLVPATSVADAARAVLDWSKAERATLKKFVEPAYLVIEHGRRYTAKGFEPGAPKIVEIYITSTEAGILVRARVRPAFMYVREVRSHLEFARVSYASDLETLWMRFLPPPPVGTPSLKVSPDAVQAQRLTAQAQATRDLEGGLWLIGILLAIFLGTLVHFAFFAITAIPVIYLAWLGKRRETEAALLRARLAGQIRAPIAREKP